MLEFNELCPSLLNKWMQAGELPNFKRFFEASQVFTSVADAEAPALEPWIQWYSIHTGLDYSQHRVFHLTDGPLRDFPDIWKIVRDNGKSVMNFSSMNAKGFSAPGSVFVPDPWCVTERAHPEEINGFIGFIAGYIQEYTNKDGRSRVGDLLRFLNFIAFHGLKPATVARIMGYLAQEKLGGGLQSWKRVAVLDWIYSDVFLHYYRKINPDFATLFLNSTAHLQHSYWRHMEPEKFAAHPSREEIERFGDAVLFGYKNMDGLLADFFPLEAKGATLVLATALSQQPFLKFEHIGGQRFYRPRNVDELLRHLGVKPRLTQPVMTHQYQLRFDSEAEMAAAASRLQDVRCGTDPMFYVEPKHDCSLYVGCQLRKPVADDAEFSTSDHGIKGRFYDHFYMMDAVKSGRHHPDGVLWFKTGEHQIHEGKVPVTDIMPTLLDYMGIDCEPSDAHPFIGKSLVPAWKGGSRVEPARGRQQGEPVL